MRKRKEPAWAPVSLKKYGTSLVDTVSQDTPISLRGYANVTTTTLGFPNGGFTWLNLAVNCNDWTDYVTLYDQFRFISITIDYQPLNQYTNSTIVLPVGGGILYYDTDATSASSGGALSTSAAAAYSSSRSIAYNHPWTVKYKYAPGSKDVFWNPAVPGGNSGNQGAIFYTAPFPGPVNTTLGSILYEIRLIARGKF